ncbi:MAG: RHS repeat-associated core domain-containing protein [Prevotellaceae bacterium]|jgi:RHS repeat-associated protein|nr:RHS repeat-associated core domain-containing protein [Prevotellaceae bacterium]
MAYKADLTPEYVIHPEGLALYSGGAYSFQFNLIDHLGNVRTVLNASAAVQQANDYFPFGLTHATVANIAKNKYLYNGKELQNDVLVDIAFDQLDYGALFYDPVIGRWHVADPLTEKYFSFSPYNYCGNDPVNRIDPTGMDWYQNNKTKYYTWYDDNKEREGYSYMGKIGIVLKLFHIGKNSCTKSLAPSMLGVKL